MPAGAEARAVQPSPAAQAKGEEIVKVGALLLAFILALSLAVVMTGCQECIRGHYETVKVPGHWETTYNNAGGVIIAISDWVPDSEMSVWHCDEYGHE